MGVVGATTPATGPDRNAGTPIRPSGTFPRKAGEGTSQWKRLMWFVGLYCASVVALGAVAFAIRLALRG
ncbi:MAG: DUF2474 family protein [Reyranellaceae bacterium]